MDRRELLGVLGATAAGLAAVTGEALAQEGKAHSHAEGDIHEKCAEACTDCEKACNQGFHYCYKQVQAGKAEHAKAMHLFVDCGEVCSTAGKIAARMRPRITPTRPACAGSSEASPAGGE